MRKFLKIDYESEIRLSLLLLILFFVLINFGIAYLLNLSRNNWRKEHLDSLQGMSYSVSLLWQKSFSETEKDYEFKTLNLRWGLKKVEILNQKGEILYSSADRTDKDEHLSSFLPSTQFKALLLSGKSFFSEIYPGKDKQLYQSYFYFFRDKNTSSQLFVRVEKEVTSLGWIERITEYEGWIRATGILGIMLILFLLLKNILSPYRRMKAKAREEKILSPLAEQENVETVVEIFQKVIAELKEKERILKELYNQTDIRAKNLEKHNEYILRSINNGVIICDNQGQITGFNQAAQKLLGSSIKLNLNRHYREILGEKSSISMILDEVVSSNKVSTESEIEIKGGKGGKRYLMINNTLLRDESENIIGLVVVLTDLTELKKIQQEVAFKQRMASVGEISAGLAHELRNSMGALLGYSKMLKKGIKQDKALYAVVESIMDEALSLENLLKRFLDFSKTLEVKLMRFNLSDLIRDCIKTAEERRPDFKFYFKEEAKISHYTGDPLLLRQVFHNLFMNSLESVENDGEIQVKLENIEREGNNFIQVVIQDNGGGIPEENLGNIFNPFYTTKEKGIGLGLSMVKKIIDLHKGKIEVKSEPGKGTAFSIFLPLNLVKDQIKTSSGIEMFSTQV
ncbi:MAG: ATP-binding protein [candidate division Zixibacteria bacterium]|nr:ATP-binding protein [candidate division Zixibacteria bacterium]